MKHWKIANLALVSCLALWAACSGETSEKELSSKKKLNTSLINNPRTAQSGEEATRNLATMDFTDTSHSFGKMYEGESASYDFVFKNNGQSPLLITNAAGACGCTVPNYPHEPIAPGASAVINVKFNSTGKVGLQNKIVNIFTNSNKGTHNLYIDAEVMEKQ
jgi:hypothetical protein